MCLTIQDCDKQIEFFRKSMADNIGDPEICKDMIDRWLDCRLTLENQRRP